MKAFLKGIHFRGNFRTSELSVFTTQSFAKANLESPLTKAKRDGVCICFQIFQACSHVRRMRSTCFSSIGLGYICCLSADKRFFLFPCDASTSTSERRTKTVPFSYAWVSPVHTYFFLCLAYVRKVCLFAMCCCVVRARNINRNTEQDIVSNIKKQKH